MISAVNGTNVTTIDVYYILSYKVGYLQQLSKLDILYRDLLYPPLSTLIQSNEQLPYIYKH